MKLHPAVSDEEAYQWLKDRAGEAWGVDRVPGFEDSLRLLSAAMAAVSAAVLPDDVEPLFP
jgi:hypothetical protein